jgi:hypothetical protein
MGLKPGEKIEVLRGPLRIVSISREPLFCICYEPEGCKKEGFPELDPEGFVEMFCQHAKVDRRHTVTRIEFEYAD